jgi:hypothetical protein
MIDKPAKSEDGVDGTLGKHKLTVPAGRHYDRLPRGVALSRATNSTTCGK